MLLAHLPIPPTALLQASLASGAVKQSYNSYPGRRLDGLVADLADWGLLSVAGQGGTPTEVLLHADRLVSIRHSGLGLRPGPIGRSGSPLGGGSRGRDGQGSPRHERATAADRQQAAGGAGSAAEPEAQLVPYLARHGSSGDPEYELIGRQLLLSGLPRAWQRDEVRVQALVEGTGARGGCMCIHARVQRHVPFGKWHRLAGIWYRTR